jgi:hypothetical protein
LLSQQERKNLGQNGSKAKKMRIEEFIFGPHKYDQNFKKNPLPSH